ncbi:hypothetical protein CPB86DRAFT_849396 [Serendipita vermifera]|nr:hypothetical protein CPB86DRAFT_849396 [Serendipita vermifera]
MKHQATWNLIFEREREIEGLEAKLTDLKQTTENDICDKNAFAAQQIDELQAQMSKIKEDVETYVEARTTELLREQGPIDQRIRVLRRANQLSRASIAPIRKVPNEVLGLIFRQFVEQGSPVTEIYPTFVECPRNFRRTRKGAVQKVQKEAANPLPCRQETPMHQAKRIG